MHRGKRRAAESFRSLTWQPRDEALGSSPGPAREAHGPEHGPDHGPGLRGLALALAGLLVALVALRLLATIAVRGTGTPAGADRPDDVLLVLLAWLGVALAAWLAVGSLLAVLAGLPGAAGRVAAGLAERLTPLAARKALTLVLGASIGSVALPVAPVSGAGSRPESVPVPVSIPVTVDGAAAGAAPTRPVGPEPGFVPSGDPMPGPGFSPTNPTAPRAPDDELSARAGGSAAVTPEFLPTTGAPSEPGPRAAGPGYVPSAPPPVLVADRARLLAPQPRPTAGTHDVVTVHRGDSLWAVAARHLGPGAGDAQIAREWPRWYAANRDVIGDDPNLLVPGQQLRPPSALTLTAPTIDVTAPVRAERGAHR